jgi:hypothetical protein
VAKNGKICGKKVEEKNQRDNFCLLKNNLKSDFSFFFFIFLSFFLSLDLFFFSFWCVSKTLNFLKNKIKLFLSFLFSFYI